MGKEQSYGHMRKEDFIFVIHPSKENSAAIKEDGTTR